MKIPKVFAYKGKNWMVIDDVDLEDDEGICDFDARIIYLDPSLKPKKRQFVFLHELYHSVIFEAHINPGTRFGAGIEEILADAFADLLVTHFTSIKWKKQPWLKKRKRKR